MTVVTRDATSGHWFPASAAECTSLLSGTGIANPASLWSMQETSGTTFADSIGAQPLTLSPPDVQMAMGVAMAGWTRLGARTNSTASDAAGTGNWSGPIGNLTGGTSSMIAFIVDVPGLPIDKTNLFTFNQTWAVRWRTTSGHARLALYDYKTNTDLATGTFNYEGSAHVVLLQADVSANLVARVVTELETLSSAIVLTDITGGKAFVLGDNGAFTSFLSSPDEISIYGGGMGWSGAAAQISAASAAIIVDRLWNGPAVASIAISPTTLTIAPPSTSQLIATVTLVDASIYDATALASWSTSDATVATVAVGLVDAIATGGATVTASMTSLGASSASGTCAVTVIPALTELVVAPANVELLTVGASQAFTAMAHYSDGSTADVTSSATWTSERPAVALVSSSGVATAVSRGTAQIGATFTSIAGSASGDASVLVSTMIDAYAGTLVALLPPGRLWRLFAGGLLYQLFAGCAAELSRFDARVADLLNEADPSTAVELLPEYESELELESTGTIQQQQARIIAAEISQQGTRPADYQATLASVLGLVASDVVVIERTPADALAMGDAREIFRFFIYRDPALPGAYSIADAQAVIDGIKQSHTVGQVIESRACICDDPHSLCDRDLLGV